MSLTVLLQNAALGALLAITVGPLLIGCGKVDNSVEIPENFAPPPPEDALKSNRLKLPSAGDPKTITPMTPAKNRR